MNCLFLPARLLLLAFLFQLSSGFVIYNDKAIVHSKYFSVSALQSSPSQQQPKAKPLRPVFVVGEAPAATGAAMALSAFEVLTGKIEAPKDERGAPPAQPVALFSKDNWQKLEERIAATDSPVLHLSSMDMAGFSMSRSLLTPAVCEGISCLGMHLDATTTEQSQGRISPGAARDFSTDLQYVLDNFVRSTQQQQNQMAFVTLDLPLHLAMLQANCLPKSQANRDSYHVLMSDGGSIHVDYLYDDDNFAGGHDPLACSTKETVLSTPPTFANSKRSSISAAAYTALRGNGMDPISSAAIAASVATILSDGDANSGISWSTIQRIVQLSRHIREFGAAETQGATRRKYTEFGYK